MNLIFALILPISPTFITLAHESGGFMGVSFYSVRVGASLPGTVSGIQCFERLLYCCDTVCMQMN